MTPQDQIPSQPEPNLFEELEQFIPQETLPSYHRYLAYARKLPPDDEMIRLLQAMGILTLITRQVPAELLTERQELQKCLAEIQSDIGHSVTATKLEMVTAENSLRSAGQELNKTAAQITESAQIVYKGFSAAGEQVDAKHIANEVADRLERQLIEPAQHAVADAASTLHKLPQMVETAKESIRFLGELHNSWYRKNIFLLVAGLVLFFSVIIGLIAWSIYSDQVNQAIAKINQRGAANGDAFGQLNKLKRTLHLEAHDGKWLLYLPNASKVWISTRNDGVIEFMP
jgi:hypothetical protein